VLGKRPGAVRVAAMRGLRRLADHPQVRQRWQPAGGLSGSRLEGA
jgi:RNA polymerase sigma-70 factor (ECF subfamily)